LAAKLTERGAQKKYEERQGPHTYKVACEDYVRMSAVGRAHMYPV